MGSKIGGPVYQNNPLIFSPEVNIIILIKSGVIKILYLMTKVLNKESPSYAPTLPNNR